jgi:hypothetical protein
MEPQRLSARQGWEWIKQGYALFTKAPLLWIVFLLIFFVAAVALSNVPVIGDPLVTLLMPVVVAGLMAGCRSLQQDEELELAHLFSGFKRHTSSLVTLGGVSLVGQFLILGAMMLAGGGTLVDLMTSGQPDPDPEALMAALASGGFAAMLGIVLFSILMMAMQYAPMLVFFNNASPVQAMKLSLRAFIHNIGPMLVYVLTFSFLAILASLPMFLGWLVLMPLVFTSLYASYCDIFPMTKETVSAPHEGDVISGDNQA